MRLLLAAWFVVTGFTTTILESQCTTPGSFPPQRVGGAFLDKDGDEVTYEKLVAALLTSANDAVKVVICPNSSQDCLVVTAMNCSTPKDLDNCSVSAPAGRTGRCQATDEFSQVGVVLAMGRDETSASYFRAWFNMAEELRMLTNATSKLPGWLSRVEFDTGVMKPKASMTMKRFDDASDGNIRMALALYLAAASDSPFILPADRTRYRQAADQLAAAVRQYNFIHRHRDVRGGVSEWLASGTNAAANNSPVWCETSKQHECGGVGFAGYHGDAMILMVAAYANSCEAAYLSAATGALQSYLYASQYASSFAVPPVEYAWWRDPALPDSDSSFKPLCRRTCGQAECTPPGEDDTVVPRWDERDAVRAVTMCKAAYYYARAGLTVPSDLQSYCSDWVATGGLNPVGGEHAYVKTYATDGTPCESDPETLKSYFNNALGTSINFYCKQSELESRLRSVLAKFDTSPFHLGSDCGSVYEPAIAITNYGTFLGRDLLAFPATAAPAVVADGKGDRVDITWTPSCGATRYEVWRRTGSGALVFLGFSSGTFYSDTNVDGSPMADGAVAYTYQVRAEGATQFSNADMAVTGTLTDDPLSAGTVIKGAHVTELRQAVLALETAAEITHSTFVDASLGPSVPVKAVHLQQVRNRLAAARATLGLLPISYTNSAAKETTIHAVDVQEVRSGVR